MAMRNEFEKWLKYQNDLLKLKRKRLKLLALEMKLLKRNSRRDKQKK